MCKLQIINSKENLISSHSHNILYFTCSISLLMIGSFFPFENRKNKSFQTIIIGHPVCIKYILIIPPWLLLKQNKNKYGFVRSVCMCVWVCVSVSECVCVNINVVLRLREIACSRQCHK